MNIMATEDRALREARRRAERSRRMRFVGWGILVPTLMALFYYAVIARVEYHTQMRFTIQGLKPGGQDALSGIGIPAISAQSNDGLIVTEFIKSPEMVRRLREDFAMDRAFRGPSVDPVGYLVPRATTEVATHFWAGHVGASYEPSSNVVTVDVLAFTAEDSLRLARGVLSETEKLINSLNSKLRSEAVKFAKHELDLKLKAYDEVRAKMTQRRASDRTSLDAETQQQIGQVGDFDRQLAEFKVERAGLQATYLPTSPQMQALDERIASVESQRTALVSSMTQGPGVGEASRTLGNEALLLDFEFAQKRYYSAVDALQNAQLRQEGERRYIVAFMPPRLPEQSNYWDRFGNVVGVALASALLIGIGALTFSVIKDHLQ
jgi:capsular polysaccharide transport system permease protein